MSSKSSCVTWVIVGLSLLYIVVCWASIMLIRYGLIIGNDDMVKIGVGILNVVLAIFIIGYLYYFEYILWGCLSSGAIAMMITITISAYLIKNDDTRNIGIVLMSISWLIGIVVFGCCYAVRTCIYPDVEQDVVVVDKIHVDAPQIVSCSSV